MKILLLGANGQLGSDILSFKEKSINPWEWMTWGRKQLDLTKPEQITTKLDSIAFDVLINCAASNRVDLLETEALQAFTVNGYAPKTIAEVCTRKNALLIQISTDYVFSGEKSTPYREEDLFCPINVYGSSKALGEQMASLVHEKTVILRTASLYGLSDSKEKGGNFVDFVVREGRQGRKLNIVKDIMMSPTSTWELTKMIFALLKNQVTSGVYHAVNSGETSWYHFAKEILDILKIETEIMPITQVDSQRQAKRPRYSVLDNEKIKKITGPIVQWDAALRQYLTQKGYL